MHSAVIGTAGYTLLSSSLIVFAILLKRGFGKRTRSSFYILSASDVLSSIFTAVILVLNHLKINTTNDPNENSDGKYTPEVHGSLKMQMERDNYHSVLEQVFNEYKDATETSSGLSCDIASILLRYAMIFFPLTNSFVSLLTLSVKCNMTVERIKNKCTRTLQSQENGNVGIHDEESSDHSKGKGKINETEGLNDGSTAISFKCRTAKLSERFRRLKEFEKDGKRTTVAILICQWLLPIVTTGIFYFVKYDVDTVSLRDFENAECNLGIDLMFDPCEFVHRPAVSESKIHTTSGNYLDNENSASVATLNDTAVNEIIFKIQGIISSLSNDTHNNSTNMHSTSFYNSSSLLDVTRYMDTTDTLNTQDKDIKEFESLLRDDNNYFQYNENAMDKQRDTETSALDNLPESASVQTDSSSLRDQDTLNQTFTIAAQNVISSYYENTRPHHSTANQSISEITETTERPTTVSREQIYADIVERIQSITAQNRRTTQYTQFYKKQSKTNTFQEKLQNSSYFGKNMPPLVKNDTSYKIVVRNSTCMVDKCYVSPQFLKLHVLIITFFIYFLPILISSILHVKGKLRCESVFNELKVRLTASKSDTTENTVNVIDPTIFEGTCTQTGWFPKCSHGKESTVTVASEKTFEESKDKVSENGLVVARELECAQKFLLAVKGALLSGTILWTPMFFEILFQTFLCMQSPEWLLNIMFVAAIFFGILRNVFNLNIMAVQEENVNGNRKENSIYPTR